MTGDDIRTIRTTHGLTQQQLAQRLARDIRTIQRWEAGEVAVPESARAALRGLDIPTMRLQPRRLSTDLDDAAEGWDESAARLIADGNPEAAETARNIAAHMRRLAGTHRDLAIDDPTQDPHQVS